MSPNPSHPHNATSTDGNQRLGGPRRARRLSPGVVSDAVVAGYLREMSRGRRRGARASEHHLLRSAHEDGARAA
jgi:hypothetical protein